MTERFAPGDVWEQIIPPGKPGEATDAFRRLPPRMYFPPGLFAGDGYAAVADAEDVTDPPHVVEPPR